MPYYFSHVFGPDFPILTIRRGPPAKFRGHAPRHDRTDPHVLVPHVLHHRFGETRQSELRSVISSSTGKCVCASHATYIDDVPTAAGSKPEQSFTAALEHAVQIRLQRPLPLIERKFANVAKYPNAGVVDQNIERAEFGVDEPEQLGNLFMTPNIGSFAPDFTGSFRRKLGDGAIDAFLPLTANCHRSAFQ